MRLKFLAPLLFSFFAVTVTVPAANAAPGEAAAVITACGTPDSDVYSKSEVTGLPMRSLTYGNTRLNFEPYDANATSPSWQFTTGWRGHLPETAGEVSKQMACFGQALSAAQAAASGTVLAADPSISMRETAAPKRAPFGIANLWMILFLFGVIAIFAVAVPRKKVIVSKPGLETRPFRRPKLNLVRFRKRPAKTVLSSRP